MSSFADDPKLPAGSRGGRARAQKLTKEERVRLAREAARTRWRGIQGARDVRLAVDTGTLHLAGLSFSCAVLDDEARVISGTEFMKRIGIYRSGALSTRRHEDGSGIYFPLYLAHKNLRPFVLEDAELVEALTQPIRYRDPDSGSVAEGIAGQVLRRICSVWVRAHRAGVLGPSQVKVAEKAQLLIEALADVAIIALIDEATGYQGRRARDDLQKILEAYIAPELMPWTRKFPMYFFEEMFRVWGWPWPPAAGKERGPQGPRYAGKLVRQLIYENLPPGVLEELERRNPPNERWQRRAKLFQHLTQEVGNPHVDQLLAQITMLFRLADDRDGFWPLYKRAFPRKTPQLELALERPRQRLE